MRMSEADQAKAYNMTLEEYQELLQWNSDENLKDRIADLEQEYLGETL